MDPQANLSQQGWLLKQISICKGQNRLRNLQTDLTELRQALYDWIRDGGFEPDWSREPQASEYFGKDTTVEKKSRKKTEKILREGTVQNNSGSNAENALLQAGNQGESVLSDPSFITDELQEEKQERKVPTITVKFKGTQKNGIHTFSDESRGASVYFNKSMFAGNPPSELTFEAPEGVFAEPGSGRAPKAASPEKLAKAAEKAEKAQERAAKAQERAAKAAAVAARLKTALGSEAQSEGSEASA